MQISDWGLWAFVETAKYILISYGIFGFKVKKGRKKYLTGLYLAAGIPLVIMSGLDVLTYRTFWGVVLIIGFFQGKAGKKLQAFLVEEIVISMIDVLIWCVLTVLFVERVDPVAPSWQRFCNLLGVAVWLLLAMLLRPHREKIFKYFNNMSIGMFLILFSVLFGVSTLIVTLQSSVIYKMTESMRRTALMIGVVMVVFLVIIFMIFIFVFYRRRELETTNAINEKQLFYQKKYYEDNLVKEEKLRKFRHDNKKHLNILMGYYREENWDALGDYLAQMAEDFSKVDIVHTNSRAVDYLINGTLDKLWRTVPKEELNCEVHGRFPDALLISDVDLCVLLGNALDNAGEELARLSGKKILRVEISSHKQFLYMKIFNTADKRDENILKSEKADRRNHGYGTKNMKEVVAKYKGRINWEYRDGMFLTDIEITAVKIDV